MVRLVVIMVPELLEVAVVAQAVEFLLLAVLVAMAVGT